MTKKNTTRKKPLKKVYVVIRDDVVDIYSSKLSIEDFVKTLPPLLKPTLAFKVGSRILTKDIQDNIIVKEIAEISPSGLFVKYKYQDYWVEYKNIKVLEILPPSTDLVKGV